MNDEIKNDNVELPPDPVSCVRLLAEQTRGVRYISRLPLQGIIVQYLQLNPETLDRLLVEETSGVQGSADLSLVPLDDALGDLRIVIERMTTAPETRELGDAMLALIRTVLTALEVTHVDV